MSLPIVAVPPAVLAPQFPTAADRTAGTFNSKAIAWANGENAMVERTREIAQTAHDNALAAQSFAQDAADQVVAAEAIKDTTQGIADDATLNMTGLKNAAQASADAAALSAQESADSAQESATNAAASAAALADFGRRYLGPHSTPPTTDNQGAPLQEGALYLDTAVTPARMRERSGGEWHATYLPADGYQEQLVSGGNIKTINGRSLLGPGDVLTASARPYESRAELRSLAGFAGDLALVESLGLFRFVAGSDEPDDDESCFATADGRWLLVCPHWDFLTSWQALDGRGTVIHGTALCTITSLAAGASATFTGEVLGALTGSSVSATAPAPLGAALVYAAQVSADNTVSITLYNPTGSNITVGAALRAPWRVVVLQEP